MYSFGKCECRPGGDAALVMVRFTCGDADTLRVIWAVVVGKGCSCRAEDPGRETGCGVCDGGVPDDLRWPRKGRVFGGE